MTGRQARGTATALIAIVVVIAVVGEPMFSRAKGHRLPALPDPANDALPASLVASQPVLSGSGVGHKTFAVHIPTPRRLLVKYACEGAGTVEFAMSGHTTSGECFAGGPVSYAGELAVQAGTALRVTASDGVRWRMTLVEVH